MYKLVWLDDYRDPFIDEEGKVPPHYEKEDIIWVKDYDEFVNYIEKNGLPEAISFDHDLAQEHYVPKEYWHDYNASKKYQEFKEPTYHEKTGYNCADWLCKYCMNNNLKIPRYFVHSANPVGSSNIRGIMEFYIKEQEK